MSIEIRKEELEKLITDYVEKQIGESVKISGIRFQEKGFYSRRIDYKNLKDIAVEVEM